MIESARKSITKNYQRSLPQGSLRARLADGTFWALIGSVTFRGLELVVAIVTARMLGQVGFGEQEVIKSTIAMIGVFAAMGLGMTGTKYVAEYRVKEPEYAGQIIGVTNQISIISSAVIMLVLMIAAPFLADVVLNAPHLVNVLRIGSVILFFEGINGVQIGSLTGFEAFKAIAITRLLRGIIGIPFIIAGALFYGVAGAISGLAITVIISCIINQWALRNVCRQAGVPISYRMSRRALKVLWEFSFPALLASTMVGPIMWVANAILVHQPQGYAEAGVYNAANQWATAILFIPRILSQTVTPMLSALYGAQDNKKVNKLLGMSLLISLVFAAPVVLILIVAREPIMGLYGPEFANRGTVLIWVALMIGLLAIETPVGKVLVASGKMWMGAIMNLGWGIALLVPAWFFLNRGWGADGLALAYLIAYSVHGIWTLGYAFQILRPKSM